MYEQLAYKARGRDKLEFGKLYYFNTDGVYFTAIDPSRVLAIKFILTANESELHNYIMNVNYVGDKIAEITAKKKNFVIPATLIIVEKTSAATDKHIQMLKDEITNYFLYGLAAKQYGSIIINDWTLDCFCTGIAVSKYLQTQRCYKMNITITTDSPLWYKDETTSFTNESGNLFENSDVRYMDIGCSTPWSQKIRWTAFGPFPACIYSFTIGFASFVIGGAAGDELADGESYIWDGINGEITKSNADGTIKNVFDKSATWDLQTNKRAYPYAPIDGELSNAIQWNGFSGTITKRLYSPYPPWEE